MRFHTDHYFAIGAAHLSSGKPCQDHALSGFGAGTAQAVIADGCSSGGHTDVGARILTLATMQAMRDSARMTFIEAITQQQQRLLVATRAILGLKKSDMLATCAFACATPDEGGVIHVQGDGTVAIKYRDGVVSMDHFEWANNAPFYPAYSANGEEHLFFAYHGARAVLQDPTHATPELLDACKKFVETAKFDEMAQTLQATIVAIGKKSPALSVETIGVGRTGLASLKAEFSAEEGVRGREIRIDPGTLPSVELIAVFSDGVSQVESMSWKDVVLDFLAMKNTNGEFVKRRLIRGIRDMRTRGKGPMDDVSAAMICVEE